MPTHSTTFALSRKRGSSLILVLILTFALSAIVAGLMKTLIFDKRLNQRINLGGEARNAAEGAVEVAVAEIDRRAGSYSSMPVNPLVDFTFPDDLRTFLATGYVDSSSIAFKSGELSELPDSPVTIDGGDPFNLPDIDKGKPVILRHAYVYGKASAYDPITKQTVTNHISNLVQVREQTWLNYAVFYNLDMEMHSGSTMDVDGPVHTNYNAFLAAGGGNRLNFYASFTTPKKIYRYHKYSPTSVGSHTGKVYFAAKEDPTLAQLVEMTTAQDSRKSGFKIFAENRWKGYVQDESFAVPPFNPPGLLQYVQDNHATTAVNEMRNSAYAMIEPQLANVTNDDAANHTYAGYKGDVVENQKFSALAGLTIRIKPSFPSAPPSAAAVIAGTDPGFELFYYLGNNPARPVNRANLPQRDGTTKKPLEQSIPFNRMSPALLDKLLDAVKAVRYVENTASGTVGNRALVAVDADPDTSGVQSRYGIYDRRQGYQKTTTNNGRLGAHHTVQIDMGKFNEFLNAPTSEWTDQVDTSVKVYDPDVSYSGIIYVQLPLIPDTVSDVSARKTTDKIRPAYRPTYPSSSDAGYAVVLRNAETLPSLPSNLNLRDDGLTFATNGPVYIMGNYNADGDSGTGSSKDPDSSAELPALIAADAVTLLSSDYEDSNMRDSALSTLNGAAFTEVATGIIAGIVPTRLNAAGTAPTVTNQAAGGVHNFVRFLENWSGDTYRYRGSVVCLYESEVSNRPWYQNEFSYWYNFPSRDVGYHVYFAGGRFPPGLPVMRTVRRIAVADITKAEYDAGPPTPPVAAN